MSDQRQVRQLRVDSDALIDGLDKMKRLEQQKRQEDVSTPAFHRLAGAVERQARHVHELAVGEAIDDDAVETTDVTLGETPRA